MKRISIQNSYIWATLIALLVIGWMLSDEILFSKSEPKNDGKSTILESETNIETIQAITVNAVRVKNQTTPLIVRASGVTETLFEIEIVARRQGIVKNIHALEGTWVNAGDLILELDTGTLKADLDAAQADRLAAIAVYDDTKRRFSQNGEIAVQLRSAKADLDSNKKTFEISKSLVKQGVQTELALSRNRALLRAAETRLFELQNLPKELELSNSYARLKAIDSTILQLQEQLDFAKVSSPQRGWLESMDVEIGQFVAENRAVAQLLGLQTLTLTIPVAQTNISKIVMGAKVDINFAGMVMRKGKVGKISATANKATRTFNVKIRLDNSLGKLRAGMTAEAEIIIGQVKAVKVSPAHLNVRDDGQLTVKVVNPQNRVKIIPVNLVRTAGNFAYISGIKDGSILLTAGQAFLSGDDLVKYSLTEEQN